MAIWVTEYKGHAIRVENGPSGERLFIDGAASRTPRPWFRREVRGRITDGDGAGEEIVASISGFWAARCTLTINGKPVLPRNLPQVRELIAAVILLAAMASWVVTLKREGEELQWWFGVVAIVLAFIASVSAVLQYRRARLAQRSL